MKGLLIVEGVEDQLFFQQLLRMQGLREQEVDVKCYPAGKGNAIRTCVSALNLGSYQRIGLVVDADLPEFGGGFSSTLKTINLNLASVMCTPLNQVAGGGFMSTSRKYSKSRIGVWIMPDNSSDGYLEHLLEPLVAPAYRESYIHAGQATLTALSSGNGYTAKPNHEIKSKMGAWLAWHDPPRMSFAKVLSQNYFDAKATSLTPVLTWIDWLFK